jgi:hypothetical protein
MGSRFAQPALRIELLRFVAMTMKENVIARSEATKRSSACVPALDCFASLAMTSKVS